ncbi:hypothetical protein ACMFMG_001861 [Clarireedia jacksonii]
MPHQMKYVNLGDSGLRVSRICVGCMSFGDRSFKRLKWCLEEADALPVIEACFKAVSEQILGKAIREYKLPRENLVIATKVFGVLGKKTADGWEDAFSMTREEKDANGYANCDGLSRKHIFDSVDASLKRLGLEYIDLLQIHRFDKNTPIKETMKALHDIVQTGKVRYIGASSMWAHQLLEMQYTARMNGWTEFISMQNLHNAMYREEEKEMVPSLKKFGMGMIPWSPVAMGFLARPHSAFLESERGAAMNGKLMGADITDVDAKINERIEEIAKKRGVSMAVVAIAWSLSKEFVTSPIIGMSKIERVQEAVEAVNFELSKEEIESIDALYLPKNTLGFS